MNFRGGCCIARYAGGGGGGYDKSKVDQIMLRYRPIAPKPDSGGISLPPEKNGSVNVSSKSRRGKRKYSKENSSSSGGGSVDSNGNSKRSNRRGNEESKNRSDVGEIMTLPLLPETPESKESPSRARVLPTSPSLWLNLGDNGRYKMATKNLDLTSELITETVASSLLTVECVTERCEEGEYELGYTDEEMKMNLERDTCPGFISDGLGRVIWTNGSYKKLVFGKEEQCSKMKIWLVIKDKVLLTQRTFTCRMRMQYTCHDNKEVSSITSFCDVWRMNDGCFAWRLDVNAALSLGR